MRVLLHGLRAAELNGEFGTILSIDSERAGVKLDETNKNISVKYNNLFVVGLGPPLASSATAIASGTTSPPPLSGCLTSSSCESSPLRGAACVHTNA